MLLLNARIQSMLGFLLLLICALSASAQTRSYPKEIRGYKVERAVVEIKKPENATAGTNGGNTTSNADQDALLTFGDPALARITPLGITFEIPIVVSPVQQKGHVEYLLFEDMVVNNTSVEIDEYHHAFDLPNKDRLTLHDPLNIYIYLPSAVLAALDEWSNSKETWRVTGRVYVFGKFKKSIFSAKRCIPVELNLTIRNPLRSK